MGRLDDLVPDRLWDFPGGLHLEDHKLEAPIQVLAAPQRVVLPLGQHIGQAAKPVVAVGDIVLRGQVIAEANGYVSTPIHASISGTVTAVEPRPVAHPSGLEALCVEIESDGRDAAAEPLPPITDWQNADPEQLRERVRAAGIVGLGGAAFPAFIKLNPGTQRVDTLVLNGAECEPYISADMNFMAQRPGDIIRGAVLISRAIGARRCLIGVEDNTPKAIDALRAEIEAQSASTVAVVPVPSRYPQGGEKQLIQTLTGKEIPSAGLPLDVGIVCHNVATAAAVWRAVVHGEPLTSRIVSVNGSGVQTPGVFEVRFGTPVHALIEAAGGAVADAAAPIMGGPMMGFSLRSDQVPVVKATNNLLVMRRDDLRPDEPERACIRCGACADACPASLLPQQLYWHSRAGELDRAQRYNLFDCIECGVCAQVCPSHIPLVQYYRHAKTEIWAEQRETRAADIARQRHEARQARLERIEAEKKAVRDAKREALRAKTAADKAAQKDAATEGGTAPQANKPKPGSSAADDILARAKAKAAAKKQGANVKQPLDESTEPRPDAAPGQSPPSPAAQPAKPAPGRAADLIAAAKGKAAARTAGGAADGDADSKASAAKKPARDPAAIIAAAKRKAAEKANQDAGTDQSGDIDETNAGKPASGKPASDAAGAAAAAIARAKAKAKTREKTRAASRSDSPDSAQAPSETDDQDQPASTEKPAGEQPSAAALIARAKAAAAARKAGDAAIDTGREDAS